LRDLFTVNGKVEIFPQKGGWMFVREPMEYTEKTKHLAEHGLVAISAILLSKGNIISSIWD
jgi:hypothetical protein